MKSRRGFAKRQAGRCSRSGPRNACARGGGLLLSRFNLLVSQLDQPEPDCSPPPPRSRVVQGCSKGGSQGATRSGVEAQHVPDFRVSRIVLAGLPPLLEIAMTQHEKETNKKQKLTFEGSGCRCRPEDSTRSPSHVFTTRDGRSNGVSP